MPRTKRAAPAETEKPEFDFNRSFQKLSWETFQKFQFAYPNKEGISLYLYRLWPLIDRKLTGQAVKNIDVFPGPVTEEDLLRKHGSGKYLLTFNDTNKPKTMTKVAETKIDLNDHDFPPVLDQNELIMGHRDNDSYIAGLKARGEWKRDAEMPHQNPDSAATAELAKLVSNMTGKLLDKEQPPAQPDPFDQALRMLTIMKEFTPKPAPIQQADPYDVALKLVSLVQGQRSEPKEDPLEVYSRVTETVERIAGRVDKGSGGSVGWSHVLLKLIEHLPGVLQSMVAMKVMGEQGGAPQQAGVPAPVMTVPTREAQMPTTASDLPAIFSVIRPYLFRAMTSGQSGDDFAAGLVTFVGQEKYDALASHGEEGLVNFLQSQADVWPMIAPYEERVREFIREFLAYGQASAEDGADDAPEAEVLQ